MITATSAINTEISDISARFIQLSPPDRLDARGGAITITMHDDHETCRLLWEKMWPVKGFFDLWQARACFHQSFLRPLRFYEARENRRTVGLLALCWDEEKQQHVQFPGETWHGKTWLEQNRIIAETPDIARALLEAVPGSVHLRYLVSEPHFDHLDLVKPDETNYLFFPGLYDFSLENYWMSFSGKSRKNLKAELRKLEARQVSFRFNQPDDLDHMFRMNLDVYKENSYFLDPRFLASFEKLASFLRKMGMLRIITVLIDGKIAAVDMGVLWKNSYTLLAGGTNPEFQGVAKLINLHHMGWACEQRIEKVDFLCGDFNWKSRFHLTPVPLYEISIEKEMTAIGSLARERKMACA